jgi:hypothetical protein
VRQQAQVEARDLKLINEAADELNKEVEDILAYQVIPGIYPASRAANASTKTPTISR